MSACFFALRTALAGAATIALLAVLPAHAQDHGAHGAAMAMTPAAATGAQFKVGDLVVIAPWSRATPKGAKIGVGYLVIRNNGTAPDRLVGVETDVAGTAEIHDMTMTNGVMKMRALPEGIAVAPGKSVALTPSGLHLMLMDLKKPLEKGQSFAATLRFEKAGPLRVTFEVAGLGAGSAPKH